MNTYYATKTSHTDHFQTRDYDLITLGNIKFKLNRFYNIVVTVQREDNGKKDVSYNITLSRDCDIINMIMVIIIHLIINYNPHLYLYLLYVLFFYLFQFQILI